jgi:diacylglycerol kinase
MESKERKNNKRDVLKGKKSRSLVQSFKHAIDGFAYTLKTEKNIKIHLLFTFLISIGGMIFKITRTEYLICLAFVALVISLELVNTAIEEAVNLACPEINPKAKICKDVSAAAVLFASCIAFIVGLAVFVPNIIQFVRSII